MKFAELAVYGMKLSLKSFFTIGQIPDLFWTAPTQTTLKPPKISFIFLVFGLLLFGFGQALLYGTNLGASPWLVFSQGLALFFGISVGTSIFLVGLFILILWMPLKEKPGVGTLANLLIVAAVIEVTLSNVLFPEELWLRWLILPLSIFLTALGSATYLVAKLGPGPRDGLMTGLQRATGLPIAVVRNSIELFVLLLGWYLGGVVGVGTVIFALMIGPAISFSLRLFTHFFR